jgi:ABC-2 type transport system ATP-binding protein
VISTTALTRRFGSRIAVEDLSFDVSRSEIVALLGPNGAGKTTTLRMLAGLIGATSGSVAIDGIRLSRATGSALRRRIGFLTEAPGLWDRLTVRENLTAYAGLYALTRADESIDRLIAIFDLKSHEHVRAAELSKGMRQKVALARALLHDPDVLLLDEPTSGLDPEVTRSVRRLLEDRRARGCAILLSTHNLDEAERLADRVAVLQQRLIAIDRPASLRKRLTTGRVLIRVAGNPAIWLDIARGVDPAATAEGGILTMRIARPEEQTPGLVRTLVARGAEILEVRPEIPALEDVYLHLMSDEAEPRQARPSELHDGVQ